MRELYLFAVADGMGGYAAGEIASRSTIKAFEAATHSLRHEQEEQNIRKVMLEAFDKANTHVYKMAVSNESYSGMGTTMTALYLPGDGQWLLLPCRRQQTVSVPQRQAGAVDA